MRMSSRSLVTDVPKQASEILAGNLGILCFVLFFVFFFIQWFSLTLAAAIQQHI